MEIVETCFLTKKFKIFLFSFYPEESKTGSRKHFITQERLVVEKFDNLRSINLGYTLSFYRPDFGLKYLITVISKDQVPKLKTSVWKFCTSEMQ